MVHPQLWSIETPHLYRLQTVLRSGEEVCDAYETPFGIRSIRFDADQGFFLNGQHVKILGTNNHQDHAGVGTAIPDALQAYRVRRLKAMGSNSIRTSHNPPTPELLDVCDRLGMLVLDENRRMGCNQEHLDHLERLIVRDRNHPCVVLWSLGNEEWAIEGNVKGSRIATTMQRFAQRLDPSRPFTVACSGGWNEGIGPVIQVMGYNYIFHGDIDEHHAKFPQQPGVGTEESNTVGTRGVYETDAAVAHLSPTNRVGQGNGTESGWQFYAARPFLAGLYYWTGFDYRGEPTPYEWPAIATQYGILDLCGFPKDTFFYLKAWWGDEPVLHVAPHWNWPGREGDDIQVTIYSNCQQVELFLNDESLGRQDMPLNGHLEWTVPYRPGQLLARGYVDDQEIIAEQVETTGVETKRLQRPGPGHHPVDRAAGRDRPDCRLTRPGFRSHPDRGRGSALVARIAQPAHTRKGGTRVDRADFYGPAMPGPTPGTDEWKLRDWSPPSKSSWAFQAPKWPPDPR